MLLERFRPRNIFNQLILLTTTTHFNVRKLPIEQLTSGVYHLKSKPPSPLSVTFAQYYFQFFGLVWKVRKRLH